MSPDKILSSSSTRIWYLYEISIDSSNFMEKNVFDNLEVIEEEEFDEEWDKITAPPAHAIKHMWSKDD